MTGGPLACSAIVRIGSPWFAEAAGPPPFLSASESQRWWAMANLRRRRQFTAGRLAAKLAAHCARRVAGRRPVKLSLLDIRADGLGRPWLHVAGEPACGVTIAHDAQVAYAACPTAPVLLGADVALRGRAVPFDPTIFHSCERDVDGHAIDRMTAFMLKEATLKAVGTGLAGPCVAVRSAVDAAGRRWVALPAAAMFSSVRWSYTLFHRSDHDACLAVGAPHRMSDIP